MNSKIVFALRSNVLRQKRELKYDRAPHITQNVYFFIYEFLTPHFTNATLTHTHIAFEYSNNLTNQMKLKKKRKEK